MDTLKNPSPRLDSRRYNSNTEEKNSQLISNIIDTYLSLEKNLPILPDDRKIFDFSGWIKKLNLLHIKSKESSVNKILHHNDDLIANFD
jgi:hypothetical protein